MTTWKPAESTLPNDDVSGQPAQLRFRKICKETPGFRHPWVPGIDHSDQPSWIQLSTLVLFLPRRHYFFAFLALDSFFAAS